MPRSIGVHERSTERLQVLLRKKGFLFRGVLEV